MTEKISLRIFWISMIFCALTFLSAVWIPFEESGDWMPMRIRFVVTFFVVGLAAALVWVPLIVYRFIK